MESMSPFHFSTSQLKKDDILKPKEENDGQNIIIEDKKSKLVLLQDKEPSLLNENKALNQEKENLEVENKFFFFRESEMKRLILNNLKKQMHNHSDAIKEKILSSII